MTHIDPAWIALVGTVFGGAGLKAVENWLNRSKIKVDDALQIRNELRIEIASQRDDIKRLEIEVNKWRQDYYDLFVKYGTLNNQYAMALERLKEEATHQDVDSLPPSE